MIRMLTSIAGEDFDFTPGDETSQFDEETEKRLIESGQAEAVKKPVKRKPAAKSAAK